MKLYNEKNNKGFTLIELMVSVTIFAIVMVVGVGAVLAVVDGNRKNQTLQVAMNNLNYAVENMTRLMKTGHGFSLTNGICNNGISFTTTNGVDVTYSLDNNGLAYTTGGNTEYVTAPEIEIDRLCFTLIGEATGDYTQPAVVMVIGGKVVSKIGIESEFSIHTSVTQRAVQY